jgi:hypothetical protein
MQAEQKQQGNWFTRLIGLSPPQLPISPEEKEWAEAAFRWLMEDLGTDVLRESVILPTAEFFPDPYEGRQQDVLPMLKRLCEYMSVDVEQIKLEFYAESSGDDFLKRYPLEYQTQHSGAAGHYRIRKGKQIIAIETGQLQDTTALVATLAHELGHAILIGENRVSPADEGHEPLTDLLTVYYGLGIFTANSAFKFSQWDAGGRHGWQAKRLGYLSEEMFGYALALFAWVRGETNPEWSKFLEVSVKSYFKTCLKYLAMTNDCSLEHNINSFSENHG